MKRKQRKRPREWRAWGVTRRSLDPFFTMDKGLAKSAASWNGRTMFPVLIREVLPARKAKR